MHLTRGVEKYCVQIVALGPNFITEIHWVIFFTSPRTSINLWIKYNQKVHDY